MAASCGQSVNCRADATASPGYAAEGSACLPSRRSLISVFQPDVHCACGTSNAPHDCRVAEAYETLKPGTAVAETAFTFQRPSAPLQLCLSPRSARGAHSCEPLADACNTLQARPASAPPRRSAAPPDHAGGYPSHTTAPPNPPVQHSESPPYAYSHHARADQGGAWSAGAEAAYPEQQSMTVSCRGGWGHGADGARPEPLAAAELSLRSLSVGAHLPSQGNFDRDAALSTLPSSARTAPASAHGWPCSSRSCSPHAGPGHGASGGAAHADQYGYSAPAAGRAAVGDMHACTRDYCPPAARPTDAVSAPCTPGCTGSDPSVWRGAAHMTARGVAPFCQEGGRAAAACAARPGSPSFRQLLDGAQGSGAWVGVHRAQPQAGDCGGAAAAQGWMPAAGVGAYHDGRVAAGPAAEVYARPATAYSGWDPSGAGPQGVPMREAACGQGFISTAHDAPATTVARGHRHPAVGSAACREGGVSAVLQCPGMPAMHLQAPAGVPVHVLPHVVQFPGMPMPGTGAATGAAPQLLEPVRGARDAQPSSPTIRVAAAGGADGASAGEVGQWLGDGGVHDAHTNAASLLGSSERVRTQDAQPPLPAAAPAPVPATADETCPPEHATLRTNSQPASSAGSAAGASSQHAAACTDPAPVSAAQPRDHCDAGRRAADGSGDMHGHDSSAPQRSASPSAGSRHASSHARWPESSNCHVAGGTAEEDSSTAPGFGIFCRGPAGNSGSVRAEQPPPEQACAETHQHAQPAAARPSAGHPGGRLCAARDAVRDAVSSAGSAHSATVSAGHERGSDRGSAHSCGSASHPQRTGHPPALQRAGAASHSGGESSGCSSQRCTGQAAMRDAQAGETLGTAGGRAAAKHSMGDQATALWSCDRCLQPSRTGSESFRGDGSGGCQRADTRDGNGGCGSSDGGSKDGEAPASWQGDELERREYSLAEAAWESGGAGWAGQESGAGHRGTPRALSSVCLGLEAALQALTTPRCVGLRAVSRLLVHGLGLFVSD